MGKTRSRNHLTRSLVVVLVAFALAAGTILTGPAARRASAQEEITAAIIEGDCGNPGDVAADLRAVNLSEGGAWTSFTTIDLAIGDLTGGGYAVVAGDPSSPDACGDITGDSDDVYVVVRAQSDANLGGIAWLHARTDRTQVSLFLGENLGSGTATAPTEEPEQPEPPVDETPEPPADDTPVPAEETPAATEVAGETTTYESPSYGYTINYDTDVWQIRTEETGENNDGPVDTFIITGSKAVIQAEFYGMAAGPGINALDIIANMESNTLSDASVIDPEVRTDSDGDEIRGGDEDFAYLAVNFGFESQSGTRYDNVYYIAAWMVPETNGGLIMIFQSNSDDYDTYAGTLATLVAGVSISG